VPMLPAMRDTAEPGLSRRERAMLDFERGWWREPGTKGGAIRARFGLSPSRYYEVLDNLIDDPDALSHDPLLVKRLRRNRAARRRQRFEGPMGLRG
jgi:Protein of unknown function (DUF3263)